VVDFEAFKALLAIVYRNAYMIDHVEKIPGIVRYEPSPRIVQMIDEIEREVGQIGPSGLLGLLHFLDILGWNEDVKYHIEGNSPTFSRKYDYKTGRLNTLTTCIRVPYQAASFVNHCLEKAGSKSEIEFNRLFTIMQQFAKSRGTCIPTNAQLVEWLSPYIIP